MSCLNFTIQGNAPATLRVNPGVPARLSVEPSKQAVLTVRPDKQASLSVVGCAQPKLRVAGSKQATLILGEVCSITSGTLTVLAATDGPLRTKDGGYLLLNPETN